MKMLQMILGDSYVSCVKYRVFWKQMFKYTCTRVLETLKRAFEIVCTSQLKKKHKGENR